MLDSSRHAVTPSAGVTTINAGTLSDSVAAARPGALPGMSPTTDNFWPSIAAATFSPLTELISGTGSVQQNGTGTIVLVRDNTYSGGTTINAGTLQLGNGGTTRELLPADVTNNGILAFDRSDVLTFGGVISGTGSVQQNGTGTIVLVPG